MTMTNRALKKSPTGIRGLDEITDGGLPAGRTTLLCGRAGCGKTLLAAEFLVRGIREFGEHGVFISFEENEEELEQNLASLGFDLPAMVQSRELFIDHVAVERSEIEETGDYDLEGLFIRLEHAVAETGARRIVLDTIESLFSGLPSENILRAELRRLFRWLKDRGLTAIVTGERGDGILTRHGLEEYVADCVILLDHRVTEQVSTRRMRIVKYRGSVHGTNEYPFLIDETGISVLPVTSLALNYKVSDERVSTGVAGLDPMLDGGYYRGSSVLVTGTAGTGKTSMAAHFADEVCRNRERCLFITSEESEGQILRNTASIGLDLKGHVKSENLTFHAARPTASGLEVHLVNIHHLIDRFRPRAVIIDPVSSYTFIAESSDVKLFLMRIFDMLKEERITCLSTALTAEEHTVEQTDVGISSLMDTWITISNSIENGERARELYIIKSRGMDHSRKIMGCEITDSGIILKEDHPGREARRKRRERGPRREQPGPGITGE